MTRRDAMQCDSYGKWLSFASGRDGQSRCFVYIDEMRGIKDKVAGTKIKLP